MQQQRLKNEYIDFNVCINPILGQRDQPLLMIVQHLLRELLISLPFWLDSLPFSFVK